MRPLSAVCVGDPEIVLRLRAWGVSDITIGETIPDRAPVDWTAYRRTVDAAGPEGLGIVVRTLDDLKRVEALAVPPAHLGLLFFTWRIPEMRQAILQTGLPLRVFGYFLELEHDPQWIMERVAYENFPERTRIVVAVLPEYRSPFHLLRRDTAWMDTPTVTELRDLMDAPALSLCAEWQCKEERTWFVRSMKPNLPITLVVGDLDTADFLPPGMTVEQAGDFLHRLARMDNRRRRFSPRG
jgi:hypothetical protein